MKIAKYHDYSLLIILLLIIVIVLSIVIVISLKAPLEHVAEENVWKEVKAATCTEDGVQCKICTDCGEEFDHQTIPATGHHAADEIFIKTKPDCVNNGIGYKACKDCGETLEFVTLPATGHTPKKTQIIDVEPTCTEEGYAHYACSECDGVAKNVILPPLGHTAEEGKTYSVPAECEKKGETYKICLVCDAKFDSVSIPATGHTDGRWIIDKHPTCTEEGNKHQLCSVCFVTVNTDIIPATGHPAESVEHVINPADCLNDGIEYDHCSLCGMDYDYATLRALGHTPAEDVIIDKETTCTENGYGHKLCTVCGLVAVENVQIKAPGHTEGKVVIENVVHTLTMGASQEEVKYCTVCGAELHRERVGVNHNTTTTEIVEYLPDCTNVGCTRVEVFCQECNRNIDVSYVYPAALGHSYDWNLDATVDENYDLDFKVTGTCNREDCDYSIDGANNEEGFYYSTPVKNSECVAPTCICGYDRYVTVIYDKDGNYVTRVHYDDVIDPIYTHHITIWDENGLPTDETIDIAEVVLLDENGKHYYNISTPGILLHFERLEGETETQAIARTWAEGNGFADGLYKCANCGTWVSVRVYNDLA